MRFLAPILKAPPVAKINGKSKTDTYVRTRDRHDQKRRTYPHMDVFSMFFGRTELILGVSKANKYEESYFELRFDVAPRNPLKNSEKLISEKTTNPDFVFRGSKNKMSGMVRNAF